MSHVRFQGYSGPSIRTMELARALSSLGHEVHLFGYLKNVSPVRNLYFHANPTLFSPRGLTESSKVLKEMDVIYERFSYLHCNIGFFLSKTIHVPVVFAVHGFPVMELKQAWRQKRLRTHYNPDFLLFSTFINFSFPEKLLDWLEKRILNCASLIVVTSEGTKKILVKKGIPCRKIHTVQNAVDPEKFSPEVTPKLDLELSPNRIIVTSTSQDIGTLPNVIKAAELLKEESVQFLLVGKEWSRHYRQIATRKKLSNVIFYGPVSHTSIPEILAASDILLALYSQRIAFFREGFYWNPIKIYEYLSMAKPIIATNIDELVKDFRGSNILYTRPNNPQDLAEKIKFISNNKKRIDEWSKKNRDFILRGHTWRERAAKLVKILEGVV